MEYRLNKVDVELRQRVNDITKEHKIHKIKHYKIDAYNSNQNNKEKYKKKGSKKIYINATKKEKLEIKAIKREYEYKTKGKFLDERE